MQPIYINEINNPDSINKIWEKAIVVPGYNPDLYRHDFAGAWISREAYGDTDSIMGWEIDHIFPQDLGGDNHFENLRPMNWRNNRSKGNDYPHYLAVVTSEDNKNILKDSRCTVNEDLQAVLKQLYHL